MADARRGVRGGARQRRGQIASCADARRADVRRADAPADGLADTDGLADADGRAAGLLVAPLSELSRVSLVCTLGALAYG